MTTDAAGATAGQEAGLFEDLAQPSDADVQAAAQARAKERSQGAARVLEPNRQQVELRASDLESLLAEVRCWPIRPRGFWHRSRNPPVIRRFGP